MENSEIWLQYSIAPGLYPKSLPVKYSNLYNFLDDITDILFASLSKPY